MPSTFSRRQPGEIRDAILHHLEKNGESSVTQIRQGVAERLKGELSESSVRSYLRLNAGQQLERSAPGVYRLKGISVESSEAASSAERSLNPAFVYGNAKLYRSDCFEWLRAQPANSVHAIVTDPPYGLVEYTAQQQQKLRLRKGGVWRIPPSFDGHQRAPVPRFTVLDAADLKRLYEFFLEWAKESFRVLVPGGHIALASNPLLSFRVATALADAGLERRGEVIRLVMTLRGGDRPKNAHDEFSDVSVMARSMWEPWLLFRKPFSGRVQDNLRRWKTGGLRRPSVNKPFGDVIPSHPTRPHEKRIAPHPSLKPQAFLRPLVRAMLPLGEGTILDPFAGSGSTLAAAEAIGYHSIGVESDPKYIELAVEAIPKLRQLRVGSPVTCRSSSDENALFPRD